MGTGWRRAFCTSIRRDSETGEKQTGQSPTSCTKLGFFSGGSNPSTPRLQSQPVSSPRLRCRTTVAAAPTAHDSPKLQCKTPRLFSISNPTSPKSPARFALFKTGFRLSKNSCGICLQSVKTGNGTAVFTAECSHAFHFPCIAAHVRKQGCLVCPVCNATWREVPLLAVHKHRLPEEKEAERREDRKSAHDSRIYDDDEPLLSPTGSRFNPIPEADEDEEEIEEFQGFFTNPSKPLKLEVATDGLDSKRVEARLLPEAAVLAVSRAHETYAVSLRVKAPMTAQSSTIPAHGNAAAPLLDPARRAPIDIVAVLDVSGSMAGAKLHMLMRAMRLVISSLGSVDRLAIVGFSAGAKRLMPLRRMTAHGQRAARRIVDRLVCGQGTCMGEALKKATKVLEDRRERNPVASIMLLSDGQDERVSNNAANRHRRPQHVSSTRFAHLEIPVHAFGFGDQQASHMPAEDAFAKCVGGLLSVVAQDLHLHLAFPAGEISAVYSGNGQHAILRSNSVRLGDLYAEEERELLVELRVLTSAVRAHHVLSVRCSYKDSATQELVSCEEQALAIPRPSTVRSSTPKIERLRNLFITTKAVAEARRLAYHNDLASAHNLLSSARAVLLQSSPISADENLRGLETELTELHWRRQQQQIQRRRFVEPVVDESGEPLTPTSAWRAAEQLAKLAIMRKSINRVGDLHGFENARF
ncbi:E3 ubiquitin-protein ligase WAV3-like [Magnolia sinica]|uniref:E3 ubiquitin-protein ligase WAV3-like n=1 Tax=Magnolia sinica TaxID=86752 RepID=UPI00265982AD|nr:E3 ubiquitin-protein ligase WAV3-like [Magnolia sinica]